ncbi:GTP-binding protein [Methylopila sp. M107]|uniref:CobW family GTP-binding protein n=1 Tax=Methylopila sp. M107 TaxID=1101190 RepID=UPI00058BEAAC|nr:GTP-binding protein [Methylopila sp. M107]
MPPKLPPPPIPLGVLTGFLGAGKTTLLNRLLQDPSLSDAAVVVNEAGEIGIDHLLVEHVADGIVALAGGCLCCSMRGDLINTLEDLLRARDNGRIPPFARLVIETSGLADPIPILQTLTLHPYLAMRYRLTSVTTVFDAVEGPNAVAEHVEAERQLAMADLVVLSKTDVASPAQIDEARATVARLAPLATVLEAQEASAQTLIAEAQLFTSPRWGEVARRSLAGEGEQGFPDGAALPPPPLRVDLSPPGRGEEARPSHGSISAVSMTSEAPLSLAAYDLFVELLRSAHGPKLLRLKGLVRIAEDPSRPLVLQGVRHVFAEPRFLDAWPDGDDRTRLVAIGENLPADLIAGLYAAFAGQIAPDRADRAALLDNPLAPRGGGGLLG